MVEKRTTPGAPRRVVYTALMGQYEKLNEQPIAPESDIDFVCFTDDAELVSSTWQIRLVEPRFPMDTIRSARYLKCSGMRLLAEYDESLWIDNSVQLRRDPNDLLDDWLADADIAIPKHSYRTTVLGEFDAVATDGYDDPARVYEQLIHYSALRPEVLQETPYWTALLARRHTPAVSDAMELWHDHITRYSRRDQLSINYVLSEDAVRVNPLFIDNMGSEWHIWPVRVDRKWHVGQDRLAGALRVPAAELGRMENALTLVHAKMAEMDEQLLKLKVERENLHLEYRSTTSWRMTAPLRAVMSLLRLRR